MRRTTTLVMLGFLLANPNVHAFQPAIRQTEPVSKEPKVVDEKVGKDDKKGSTKSSPLGGTSVFGEAPLPTAENGKVRVPPLVIQTTAISEIGTGVLPKDSLALAKNSALPLPEGADRQEPWSLSRYSWQASNTFSHPLYFEDAMLERHGHEFEHHLTPFFSGVRFFATVPALPYLMTVHCPDSTLYTLGYWRPGTCAPNLLQRPPFQPDAAIVEAAAITGGVLLLP